MEVGVHGVGVHGVEVRCEGAGEVHGVELQVEVHGGGGAVWRCGGVTLVEVGTSGAGGRRDRALT